MDSGRSRQRIEFRNVPTMVALQWVMTQPQAALFEAWAAQVVGAGWFTIELLTPLGFEVQEVRFTETPIGGELAGKFLWRYKVACEVRNRPLLASGWADILPGFVLGADIFDYAMNREWPAAAPINILLAEGGQEMLTEDGRSILVENERYMLTEEGQEMLTEAGETLTLENY
jgi:hypothetical protein